MGWISPSISILLSDDTPLTSGPISYIELSWLGSISNIGSLFGIFAFGGINLLLGCKRTILLLGIPSTLFWILIYFGETYYHVLIARFFAGLTGSGIQICLVLYIAEIANDS